MGTLPVNRDILDQLHGSCYFAILDGASVYWSVLLSLKSREDRIWVPTRAIRISSMPWLGLIN